jgi:hypothetical protein
MKLKTLAFFKIITLEFVLLVGLSGSNYNF